VLAAQLVWRRHTLHHTNVLATLLSSVGNSTTVRIHSLTALSYWVVRFTSRPFYPQQNSSRYSCRSGRCAEC